MNVFNKELLALRNNFRVIKKFLIAKCDCTSTQEQETTCCRPAAGENNINAQAPSQLQTNSPTGNNLEIYLLNLSTYPSLPFKTRPKTESSRDPAETKQI